VSRSALIILIGCLAAAVSILVWLGRRPTPIETANPAAPLIKAIAEDALREIDLACDGTEVTLRRKTSPGWRITRPFEAEADLRRVNDLLASLQEARVSKVIGDDGAHREAYGLSPAACTVKLGFLPPIPGVTLRLGRSSPVGSERYAAGDDGRVVLTDGSLFGAVSRGAEAFREKRLFPVDPEAITRIALDRSDGRLIVALASDAWRLEAPYPDAASSAACAGLARAVTSLEFVGPEMIAAPVDTRPARLMKLEVTVRGDETALVAFVATAGIDGKRLGWRKGVALAGLVAESAARELLQPSESFRDPRMTAFSSPEVRRVTIERGGTTLRIVRTGEASPWSGSQGSVDFAVDGRRVGDLLDRLRGLTASGFEPAAPKTAPTGTISIENESDALARLTWGSLDSSTGASGGGLWLTTPARPGVVFRMDASSLGSIPAQAADLAPPSSSQASDPGGR
jgi:hypothetical protein